MSNQKIDSQNNEIDDSKQLSALNVKPSKASYTFYGSKLFVKCFGWFIFITFINLVLASSFVYFYHYRPAKEKFDRISARILQNNGQLMMETYEKQGSLSFFRFRGPGNFWLFDEKLNKIFDGVNKDYIDFIPPNKPISENDNLKPSVLILLLFQTENMILIEIMNLIRILDLMI